MTTTSSSPVLTLEEARPRLREAYRQRQLIPFLGAGFSAPLGLPQWRDLVAWMAEPLGFDPELFELNGTPLQLAAYYALESEGGLSPLLAQMRRHFHAPEAEARRGLSPQHQALARLGLLRRIYTTNFEHHIEEALREGGREVKTLIRVEDFMRPTPSHACEVVKFRLPLLIPDGAPRTAHVIQMVCYCDEKRLHVYPGRIDGSIAPTRRGGGGIHWDSMFIPEGHTKTLGEMGADERIAAHAFFKAYAALRVDQGI